MIHFMIVDDSPIFRNNLKEQIQELGSSVVCEAENGIVALDLYKKNKDQIDVVTLDISMPKLNGIETLKELMKIDQDVIVYMITSHGEESVVIDSIDLGAKGYILKPITNDKMKQLIEEINKNEL